MNQNIKEFEEALQKVIHPANMMRQFESKEQFIEWLELGTVADLKATLNVFEESQHFEECRLIQNVIDSKIN